MKNSVTANHRFGERGQIKIVAFDKLEVRMLECAIQKFTLAGGKIIPADDGLAVCQQAINQVAADKPRRASDENLLHDRS